uniref:Uncharacterized protein n=2 Tax=Plectus sambesii TaxID=2011161 RepID=A0A914W3R3_9BILA
MRASRSSCSMEPVLRARRAPAKAFSQSVDLRRWRGHRLLSRSHSQSCVSILLSNRGSPTILRVLTVAGEFDRFAAPVAFATITFCVEDVAFELIPAPSIMDYIKQVCVTGDVSTLVNDENLMETWAAEVAKEIWEQKPQFGAIHVQGLKDAADPDAFADKLVRSLIALPEEMKAHFDTSRAFFDSRETGLGSIYLFQSGDGIEYFDKHAHAYRPVNVGHQSEIGTSECEGFYAKSFQTYNALHYEGTYAQNGHGHGNRAHNTGYLMARYRIFGKELTFINLNLHSVPFQDVSEIVEQPEVTKAAKLRQQQIDQLLENIESEGLKDDAIIVAGAFNAQLQETNLLSDFAHTQRATSYAKTGEDGTIEGIEQRDREGRKLVTVESQRFDLHTIHDWFFRLGRGQMVKKYNGELAQVVFGGKLLEESVFFRPSRHYAIDEHSNKDVFMRNLCPAWADRVLYNHRASDLFRHDSFCASGLYYGLVADTEYVGQHKPVALHASICLKN